MKKYFSIILLIVLLQSCSSGISGTYSSGGGMSGYSFRFEKNGKVYVSAMGVESEVAYEKDGNKIKIMNSQTGGNMILTMMDENTILGPLGTTLHKQ